MATTVIYSVDSTDGGVTLVIQPRTVNGANGVLRNTDLTLYGNATPNWGERFNENFYRLTENFAVEEKGASPGTPQDEVDLAEIGLGVNNPLQGQMWYNKSDDRLYVQTTPTLDLDTIPASWTRLPTDADIGGVESGLQTQIDNKVSIPGDIMTGKLEIAGGSATDDMLEVSSDGGPLIDFKSNTLTSTPPVLRFYNPENDPGAGGISGLYGWTKLSNRDGRIFAVEYSDADDGTASGGSTAYALEMYQTGGLTYSGIGAGTGDISIPNALVTNPNHVTTKSYVDSASSFPAGIIAPFAGSVPPSNFTFCDGSLKDSIAQPQYAALFAAIGTQYGGTGANAFNVPNMQGRTPVGIGGGLFTTLGQLVGAETHALTDSENGPHIHTATVTGSTDAESSHDHYTLGGSTPTNTGASGSNKPLRDRPGYTVAPTTPHSHTISGATVTVNPAGAGAPHNNIQPSFGVNYIISL